MMKIIDANNTTAKIVDLSVALFLEILGLFVDVVAMCGIVTAWGVIPPAGSTRVKPRVEFAGWKKTARDLRTLVVIFTFDDGN